MSRLKPKFKLEYLFILKTLFSLGLIVASLIINRGRAVFLYGLIELLIIVVLSQKLLQKNVILGNIFNDIFILILNSQFIVHIVSKTFITVIMIDNLGQINNIIDVVKSFLFFIILIIIFTFLPIKGINKDNIKNTIIMKAFSFLLSFQLLSLLLFGELVLSYANYYHNSPLYSFEHSVYDSIRLPSKGKKLKEDASIEDKNTFYREDIPSGNVKYQGKNNKPNIVVIFTEGLSKNVIDDERNITPNLKQFQDKSICFDNYYNHTFATFRGIIGQLYSGYQFCDFDKNNLVSIQSLLDDVGYNTSVIGSEPTNTNCINYFKMLGFNKSLLSGKSEINGCVSDKTSYEFLFKHINEQYNTKQPFFSCLYTVGTHAYFDPKDQIYGDGSNVELNKFYNMDYYFGKFIKEFNNSPASDNTIIVFTSDHASFAENYYAQAFPNYNRKYINCDTIPLMIYYKGCKSQRINAECRNSIDFAPTILDFINYNNMKNTKVKNYFLGNSLLQSDVIFDFEHVFNSYNESAYVDRGFFFELKENEDIMLRIDSYLRAASCRE